MWFSFRLVIALIAATYVGVQTLAASVGGFHCYGSPCWPEIFAHQGVLGRAYLALSMSRRSETTLPVDEATYRRLFGEPPADAW